MTRLTPTIPLILLLIVTPTPAVCNVFFADFVEQVLTSLNATRHKINNPLETLTDKNYGKLLKSLTDLPEGFQRNVYRLSDTYANMTRTWENFTVRQGLMNRGILDDSNIEDLVREKERIDSSWYGTREYIRGQKFLTKMPDFYKRIHNEPGYFLCRVLLSDMQIRYTLFQQYMSYTKNYFISAIILYNIREYLGDIYATRLKQEFISIFQDDLDEDSEYFRQTIKDASREFWLCDPGMTASLFYELEAYTTYYAVQENLYPPCHDHCSDVSVICRSEYDDGLCNRTRVCDGPLLSCTRSMEKNMCLQNEQTQLDNSTYPRYLYIDTTAGYRGKGCLKSIITLTYYLEVLYGGNKISDEMKRNRFNYYNCLCHENQYYVSTFPVTASPGYIIIGGQLNIHDYTLYMDVIEGMLQPDGNITKLRYKSDTSNYFEGTEWRKYRVEIDLDTKFDLSPTMVPPNENRVVTELQFAKKGHYIYLAVNSTVMNVTTGALLPNTARIFEKTTFGREELKMGEVDRPEKSMGNLPVSNDNQYVKLNVTGLWEDGGQSTIPFIDNQRVYRRTPLSGVSLYVRGRAGYGGFLALKLYTVDLAQYIRKGRRLVRHMRKIEKKLKLL